LQKAEVTGTVEQDFKAAENATSPQRQAMLGRLRQNKEKIKVIYLTVFSFKFFKLAGIHSSLV
jgi:hypothetical protein